MGRQAVKKIKNGLYGISRDGELIGTGMTYEEAGITIVALGLSYPESNFKIIPHPKSGKKVNP
jgi:pyruvate dehydrogenase complex dehydrogenase (E1) component